MCIRDRGCAVLEVGPAKTKFADWFTHVNAKVPDPVTGEPVTLKWAWAFNPTDVTVPVPPVAEIVVFVPTCEIEIPVPATNVLYTKAFPKVLTAKYWLAVPKAVKAVPPLFIWSVPDMLLRLKFASIASIVVFPETPSPLVIEILVEPVSYTHLTLPTSDLV